MNKSVSLEKNGYMMKTVSLVARGKEETSLLIMIKNLTQYIGKVEITFILYIQK